MSRARALISGLSLVLLLALDEAFVGVHRKALRLQPALGVSFYSSFVDSFLWIFIWHVDERNWYDVTSRVIESAQPLANAFRLLSGGPGVYDDLPLLATESLALSR